MKHLTDRIRKEIARGLISVIAPVIVAGCCISILTVLILSPDQPYRMAAPIAAILLVIPALVLNRKGKAMDGVPFLIGCILVPLIMGMVLSGGVHAPVYVGSLLVPGVVLFLYGIWQAVGAGISLLVIGFISIVLQKHGFLSAPPEISSYFLLANYAIWIFLTLCLFAVPGYLMLTALDESNRQREAAGKAGREREKAEAELKGILSQSPDILFRLDRLGRFTFVSDAVSNYGYCADDLLGNSFRKLFHPDDFAVLDDIEQIVSSEDIKKETFEIRLLPAGEKPGSLLETAERPIMMVDIDRIGGDGDDIFGIQGVARDITRRKQYELELLKLATVIEQAAEEIVLTDAKGNITYVNQRFEESTGYTSSEVLGKNPRVIKSGEHDKAFYSGIWETITAGRTWKGQIWNRTKDGKRILHDTTITPIIDASGAITGYASVRRDMTEFRKMQDLMVQTEKMMAVGGLAAGMAHEINNPLGIILQAAQNARRRLGVDIRKNHDVASALGLDIELMQKYIQERSINDYLESISRAGERAAKIVRSMLNFSRKSESKRVLLLINDVLDSVLEMVENDYDFKKHYDFRSIQIIKEYGSEKKLECTETEIAQVFFNIIKNAGQAVSEISDRQVSPPCLTIRTRDEMDFVTIEIEDNGPGIAKENLKKIFNPFFTTKPSGEGTGLGLSVSYFIVTSNHSGNMRVKSQPNKGTCFIIQLPVGIRGET